MFFKSIHFHISNFYWNILQLIKFYWNLILYILYEKHATLNGCVCDDCDWLFIFVWDRWVLDQYNVHWDLLSLNTLSGQLFYNLISGLFWLMFTFSQFWLFLFLFWFPKYQDLSELGFMKFCAFYCASYSTIFWKCLLLQITKITNLQVFEFMSQSL